MYINNNNGGYNPGKRPMSDTVESDEPEMELEVCILLAEGLEDSTGKSHGKRYGVEFWVHRDVTYIAHPTEGYPKTKWNWKFPVEVDRGRDCRFLYVEVVRVGDPSDPGTSTGEAVVGRARIALPKLSNKKGKRGGRYGLVRVEGGEKRPEGHIELVMEWKKKIVRRHRLSLGRSEEAP